MKKRNKNSVEIDIITKYNLNSRVVVDGEFNGVVVGIKLLVSRPNDMSIGTFLTDTSYLINVDGDVIEADELILQIYRG